MKKPYYNNVEIDNAEFMFRPNFEGRQEKFNALGNKNFTIKLHNEDLIARMQEEGWTVKFTKPTEDFPNPEPYIKINVSYKMKAPKIHLVRGTQIICDLDEEMIRDIDYAKVTHMDMVITPSSYTQDDGETWQVSAYLDELWIEFEQSRFSGKYSSTPAE